jgi:serine protease Do
METRQRTFGRWIGLVAVLVLGVALGAGSIGLRESRARTPEKTSQKTATTNPTVDLSGSSVAEQLSNQFAAVAKMVTPSVVTVFTETNIKAPQSPFGSDNGQSPFEQFFGDEFFHKFFEMPQPQGDLKRSGLGSGVIIGENGLILTNNHVIDDADNIKVRLIDGREFEAKVKGRDPQTDLAVLTIDAKGLQPIELGNSDEVRVGDWVLAIGSPLNPQLEHSVTSGIISAKGRSAVGLSQYEDYIQTDAAINPGNSGGALVNMKGQLIGVNTAIATPNGGFSGIGFAIPVNLARSVSDDIVKTGKVVRGWLGVSIQNISPDMAKALHLETNNGVIVTSVEDGSPAAKAGLKTEDVVVDVNGGQIDNATELSTRVAGMAPGTTVTLGIIRDGKTKDVSVTLGELKAKTEELARGKESNSSLGLVVADITSDLAQKYELPKGTQGVVVTSVQPGSVAYEIGMQEGDVIVKMDRKEIRSVKDFETAMSKTQAGDQVLLYVQRGDANFFAAFTMPQKMVP